MTSIDAITPSMERTLRREEEALWADERLSPQQKFVLLTLHGYTWDTESKACIWALADVTGLETRQILRAMRRLEQIGWIKRTGSRITIMYPNGIPMRHRGEVA